MKRILFLQRPFDDVTNMKVLECYTCDWYTTYVDDLWTSNDMPESQASAFNQCNEHGREAHSGAGRIVRCWRT